MPADLAIDARGLRRSFGARAAVDGVDLQVARGETLALLGPNGAGKTTTVSMLTTLLPPTGGAARVAGYDIAAAPGEVRRRIGVVFQGPSLEVTLTARQNLKLHADLYGVPRREAEPRIQEILAEAELADREGDAVWKFSGGMRRRLELVRAVLHRPEVLFLDEPTVGLDPQARRHAWALLEKLQRASDMAILLTTHDMHEADRLARRVAIMDQGRVLAAAPAADLKAQLGQELVVLRFERGAAQVQAKLDRAPGVRRVEWQGDEARVHVDRAERALPALLQIVEKQGAALASLDLRRPTLEDVFLATTGHKLRDAP